MGKKARERELRQEREKALENLQVSVCSSFDILVLPWVFFWIILYSELYSCINPAASNKDHKLEA